MQDLRQVKHKNSQVFKALCGLCLKKGEKRRLYEICIKYNIPITYPQLFLNEDNYYLWGISSAGIGLISTIIMNHLNKNNGIIFHSLEELEEFLNS